MQLTFFILIILLMNIILNIIIESKNTGKTLYLQFLKKGGKKMKGDLFIRNILIIIVILLALNILLPTLSNSPTSYAAKNIEYKIIDFSEPDQIYKTLQQIEICFNELGKEGWEFMGNFGSFGFIMIFKR